jgi:Lsr2
VAQKVVVSLVDDLTGTVADETVEFGLDGKTYEIDLSSSNATRLREALASYVAAARRPGGRRAGRRSARAAAPEGVPAPSSDREHNQAIREWARARGMKVSERGRLSAELVEAYRQEN